jgi:hypothetical protein
MSHFGVFINKATMFSGGEKQDFGRYTLVQGA